MWIGAALGAPLPVKYYPEPPPPPQEVDEEVTKIAIVQPSVIGPPIIVDEPNRVVEAAPNPNGGGGSSTVTGGNRVVVPAKEDTALDARLMTNGEQIRYAQDIMQQNMTLAMVAVAVAFGVVYVAASI